MKKCMDCALQKPLEDFHKAKNYKNGIMSRCKKCHRSRMKEWEQKNHDKCKGYWRKRNAERFSRACEVCGKVFVSKSRDNSCSIRCKLMLCTDKNTSSRCWEWTRYLNKRGYAQISVNSRSWEAHRISYETFKGEIPKGLYVLHSCDNRKCVNPEHLFLGTQKDNIQDMIKKDRRRKKCQE